MVVRWVCAYLQAKSYLKALRQMFCALLLVIGSVCVEAETGGCDIANVPFWIGTDNLKEFNDNTISLIADCAGLLVLNGPISSGKEKYRLTYSDLVKKIKKKRPDLPVLGYAFPYQWYKTNRIGTHILSGLDKESSWWLLDRSNLPEHIKERGPIFFDITKKHIRDSFVTRIAKGVEQYGLDGIALDVVYRTPTQGRLGYWCRTHKQKCNEFSAAIEILLRDLRFAIGDKLIIINGIYPEKLTNADDQLKLLKHIDGMIIEYFGMVPKKGISDFHSDIEYYFGAIEKSQNKKILVYGRAPWRGSTKAQDIQWGGYLYAAYLMASNENTMFKFHSTFQEPNTNGNLGGFTVLDVMKKEIGKPVGARQVSGDLYVREFESAYVGLRRHDSDQRRALSIKNIPIPDKFHAPEELSLFPGDYFILNKASAR